MCRNITRLRFPDRPATDDELRAAALQFVRKITGFQKPSRANQAAFEAAIAEISASARELLDNLVVRTSA
jgi:hypothetical protein